MHKLLKPSEVAKLCEKWQDSYRYNNKVGNLVTSFIAGDQWSTITKDQRKNDGKEVLTLNMVLKHYYRILADFMQVEYQLQVKPQTSKTSEQILNAEKLLKAIILENDTEVRYNAFAKFASYGYSVFEMTAEYKKESSYQLIPTVKNCPHPELAFFDCDAVMPTKQDGKFCGKVSFIHEDILHKLYPTYEIKTRGLSQTEVFGEYNKVKVYDFFFKEERKIKYFKMGKKFKSEDRLTEYEKTLEKKEFFEKLVPVVYACRCTDDEFLLKPQEYYINELPLVFIGDPFIIKEGSKRKEIIVPYMAPLLDIQQILNNAASQISSQATKKIERSIIMSKAALDQNDLNVWQNFNTKAALLPWKPTNETGQPNAAPIILEPPILDASLIQLMQVSKIMLDEVAGINLSQQGSAEDGAQSGVALAQRIAQGDLVQKKLLYTFVKALNRVGELMKAMMASLIKEEYEIKLGNEFIKLNELSLSSFHDEQIRERSLESLHEDYDFTIEASPSSQLEKMRSRETYINIARAIPQITPYLIDLMAENLDVNNALELIARLRTLVDPDLRAVGKGEMSEKEYYKIQQQRAQQQQQSQQDPAMALVQMEGQNNQQKAQLKAKELEQKFVVEKNKLALQRAKLMSENSSKERDAAIKLLATQEKNLERRINAGS